MRVKNLVKLLDGLGEWLDWEPETIRTIELSEEDINKALALQTSIVTQTVDGPLGTFFHFTDWHLFEKVVLALNNSIPDFDEVEEAEPHEIHFALKELEDVYDNITTLGESVAKYVAASYLTANIVFCPFYDSVNALLDPSELKDQVEEAWKSNTGKVEGDDVVAVQLSRLLMIERYRGDTE